MSAIKQRDVQARYDRITEIFSDMVSHAQRTALRRCPYKNRFSECTAKFKCGLQGDAVGAHGLLPCLGNDKIGYCTSWTNELLKCR